MRHCKRLFLWICCCSALSPAIADEGMWMLPQIKEYHIKNMKGLGLELCAEDIYHPDSVSYKDAVVVFGGGCTGEVISPEGLILTNHHCGYSFIQNHSSVGNDLLTDGFWAKTKADELPNPGLKVKFIDKIEDVTQYVKDYLENDSTKTDISYLSQKYLNALAEKKIGADFLKNNPGTVVEIKPFYGGNTYFMFTQKEYSDVRMVGAPPSSIGKFGADTDNWMWPRHCGDFSLFRVYTDKDGNPAEYSKENIPLRPKKYFSISLNGVLENDFAMILGFPGRTNQFFTAPEVQERKELDNDILIRVRDKRQEVILNEMLANDKVRIQYSGKYAASTNSYKRSKGLNKMIDMQSLIAQKKALSDSLLQWATPADKELYTRAIATIDSIVSVRKELKSRQFFVEEALLRGIEFSKVPYKHDSLFVALQNKDKKKIKSELETFEKSYKKFFDKNYSPEVDAKVAKAMLKLYAENIPTQSRPSFFAEIDKKYNGNIDKYIDDLFSRSIYGNPEKYAEFMKKPSVKKLKKDGMVLFAQSVSDEYKNIIKAITNSQKAAYQAQKIYTKGIMDMTSAGKIFPDANFTLRLTYGQVMPLVPRDGVCMDYYTTLDGVMQKEDSTNWEFVVHPKLKKLYESADFGRYARKDGKMPINFIANTHTTGGNSGSPVIDGKGRLIGTGFDRNWEGISGDIKYQKAYQRTLILDIRYTLFIIDKFADARHLLDEMTIIQEK